MVKSRKPKQRACSISSPLTLLCHAHGLPMARDCLQNYHICWRVFVFVSVLVFVSVFVFVSVSVSGFVYFLCDTSSPRTWTARGKWLPALNAPICWSLNQHLLVIFYKRIAAPLIRTHQFVVSLNNAGFHLGQRQISQEKFIFWNKFWHKKRFLKKTWLKEKKRWFPVTRGAVATMTRASCPS